MPIEAKVVCDSVCATRITTMVVTLPKFLVAQFNTHRVFSRNSASSRAIPARKLRQQVLENPYIPSTWPSAQKGMAGGEPLKGRALQSARLQWATAREAALSAHQALEQAGVAKELCNRVLEPWMWTQILVTSTEWDNFFQQRLPGHGAQEEMSRLAMEMKAALDASVPQTLESGEWHLPLTSLSGQEGLWQSAARCARISYKRQEVETTLAEDKARHDSLVELRHWSPLEHQAKALLDADVSCRNFKGWQQYRGVLDVD